MVTEVVSADPLERGFLLANTEPLNRRSIALEILGFEIVEQSATSANELQQTASAVVVLLVNLEMFSQLGNALCEQGDLHLG